MDNVIRVSVCMATYNGGKYIKEQMDSILNQEFKDNPNVEMEIIVSDDGSKDDTIQIIQNYHDDRIKLYHHKNNVHHRYNQALFAATHNFWYAISQATGDYIFLSDQDDVWYPWKIDVTLNVLLRQGGVCAVAFDVYDGGLRNKIGTLVYPKPHFFTLTHKNSVCGFSCGLSREELKYLQPFPDVPQHDTFIMLMALWRNKLYFVDRPCAIHRWSGVENVSISSKRPIWFPLYYRLKMWVMVIWRSLTR